VQIILNFCNRDNVNHTLENTIIQE